MKAEKVAKKTLSKAPVKAKKTAPKVKAGAPMSHGVGRRKSSVARVWLRRGTGKMVVNDRECEKYFFEESAHLSATSPFKVYPHMSNYDLVINVQGGGINSQADATKLGIARAVVKLDESTRSIFKKAGLLTVDSRLKERKKYGQKAARRKFQFVKR